MSLQTRKFLLSLRSLCKGAFICLAVATLFSGCRREKPDPVPEPPTQLSSEKEITSFDLKAGKNGGVLALDIKGKIENETITLELGIGTPINSLVPSIEFKGVLITPFSDQAQDFTNPVNYTVTAENGSTRTYTVKVVLVKANLKLFVGSTDGYLYALHAQNGSLIWKYQTSGEVNSSPTFADNTVYVGSNDGYLHAIDANTGQMKWKFRGSTATRAGNPVVADGTVYFNSVGVYPAGDLYALNSNTGEVIWRKTMPVAKNPVLYADKVIAGDVEGRFMALNRSTGEEVWKISLTTIGNPVVENGKVFVLTNSGIRCIDIASGNSLWFIEDRTVRASSPSLLNGRILVSCPTNVPEFCKAFDATNGNEIWYYTSYVSSAAPLTVNSAPLGVDSLVYPGFHRGALYALRLADGSKKWTFNLSSSGMPWFSNPTVSNHLLYVGASDGYVYAINSVSGAMVWKFPTNGVSYSGPCVVDSEGQVQHAGDSGARQ